MASIKIVVFMILCIGFWSANQFQEIEARLYQPTFKLLKKHSIAKVCVVVDDLIGVVAGDINVDSKWYKVIFGGEIEKMMQVVPMWDSLINQDSSSNTLVHDSLHLKFKLHSNLTDDVLNRYINQIRDQIKYEKKELGFKINKEGKIFDHNGNELELVVYPTKKCVLIAIAIVGVSRSYNPKYDSIDVSVSVHLIDWILTEFAIPKINVYISVLGVALFFIFYFWIIYACSFLYPPQPPL